MYVQNRSRIKRIAIDTLGVLLVIAAALTGWLPGPGGIPLLIIGLSLLATNHEWAERLLQTVKNRSGKMADKLFDGHPAMKWTVDIAGIVLIAAAVLLLTQVTKNIAHTAAISLFCLALVLLLGNRKRFHRIKRKLRKT